jgi:hypothetical protein
VQLKSKKLEYEIVPENEYNMDEKGFLIGVLQERKRVFNKQMREQGLLLGARQDGNREWVTVIGCICADGTHLPPGIIYQATSGNVRDTWVDDFDPQVQLAHFTSTASGWTNVEIGFAWLTTVFNRYTKPKARNGRDWRMLYVDGHGSHLNMRFLDYCLLHRILVINYPLHSTHRL